MMERTFSKEQVARVLHLTPEQLEYEVTRCGLQNRDIWTQTQLLFLAQTMERQDKQRADHAKQLLQQVVEDNVVLLDTNIILNDKFELLLSHLLPLLVQTGNRLIIPARVMAELPKVAREQPEQRAKVKRLTPLLEQLIKEDRIAVYGDVKSFADPAVLAACVIYRTTNNIAVITNDRDLARDILLHVAALRSIHTDKQLSVYSITSYGYLSRYRPAELEGDRTRPKLWYGCEDGAQPVQEPVLPQPLPVQTPTCGETVWGTSGAWNLGEKISSGAEGTVYDLGDGTVAKLFRSGKLTGNKKAKLTLQVEKPLRCRGVCWPQELLYDRQKNLVGYRMPKARGKELEACCLKPTALERHFPQWTRVDLLQLIRTVLELIESVHRHGLLLGDLNGRNFLVQSPTEVYLVDCDSMQVGRYPCTVGTTYFTPPELQGVHFDTVLRTEEQERFAVATLVFELLMGGKAPYAQQGGQDAAQAILQGQFPYPFAENPSKNPPMGQWRFLWSHMPYFFKEAFYHSFQKGGDHYEPQDRLTAEDWLRMTEKYQNLLRTHKLPDEESYKLFPTRLKVRSPEDLDVVATKQCIDCGEEFDITSSEYKLLQDRGWKMPTRCPMCRKLHQFDSAGCTFSTEGALN